MNGFIKISRSMGDKFFKNLEQSLKRRFNFWNVLAKGEARRIELKIHNS